MKRKTLSNIGKIIHKIKVRNQGLGCTNLAHLPAFPDKIKEEEEMVRQQLKGSLDKSSKKSRHRQWYVGEEHDVHGIMEKFGSTTGSSF